MDHNKINCKSANSGHDSFPCLNSNISIQNTHKSIETAPPEPSLNPVSTRLKTVQLSTQNRKTAFILKESVQRLSDTHGLNSIGFLTLTFAQHIICPKEAQRRLNSLISNVINNRYFDYVGVMERQKSGRIHYHLLVATGFDIKTGFDFSKIGHKKARDNDYSSANGFLRSEWAFWRKTAKNYGFGRTELLPVRSNIEAMAKYVGKYIAKHVDSRKEEDKGVRLVRYSRGARAGTTRFQFQSEGSAAWRRKIATFAQIVQHYHPERTVTKLSDLSDILGKRWAYYHRDYILQLP